MTTSYAAGCRIQASAERVWAILTDPTRYPEWNPTVVSIEGRIAAGEKIRLVSTLDPNRTFKLHIAELEAPRHMIWSGGMPLGLFTGERVFTLTEVAGATDFHMEETYSGPMAPMITKAIPDMSESFAQFADALKRTAEA
jgi:hypothetical protein